MRRKLEQRTARPMMPEHTRTMHVSAEIAHFLMGCGHRPLKQFVDLSDGSRSFLFTKTAQLLCDQGRFSQESANSTGTADKELTK